MELIIATIASLLPIINPFSTAPMFLAMTQGDTEQYRNLQAKKGVLYMIIILLVATFKLQMQLWLIIMIEDI